MNQFRRMASRMPGPPPAGSGPRGPRVSISPETKRMIVTAAIIFGLLGLIYVTSSFWVTWWWFESMGYSSALTTSWVSQAVAFAIAAFLGALFFRLNAGIAMRTGEAMRLRRPAGPFGTRFGRLLLTVLTLLVALGCGSWGASRWREWRLFTAGRDFGVADPIFGRDAAWYVFRLPAIEALQSGALVLVLWTVAVVAAIYAVSLGLERLDFENLPRRVTRHVLSLVALGLLLVAAGYVLSNFDILSSRRGFAYGGGFTDVNVVRPLNWILAIVSLAAAVLVLLNGFRGRARALAMTGLIWLGAVLVGLFLPAVVQQTVVEPSELSRERPFIANNIGLTRAAYALDTVDGRNISGQGVPPASEMRPDSDIFDNIRLWDYRIVRQTFQQLRSFVPYYVFSDVDVDRYSIDGRTRQVLVSARELDVNGLPANAQTWVNRHLAYTHGYAMVVSPISEATAQGLPRFLVGGIPPEGTGPLAIDRPQIYFGEQVGPWVAVQTQQPEISGISGETASEPYAGEGRGSIQISNYLKRVMLAISLGDRRILLSSELTPESRFLLTRQVAERAQAVAPYLVLDPDPYLVIVDGQLLWVIDAYTGTTRFPGATPSDLGVNYLRNTVKVTVDAYDGGVTLYRTAVPDPIADAWGVIYGNPFRPVSEAPAGLADHFRYPEAMFNIQSELFASYHVTDPDAFYNGEDRWAIAQEDIEQEGRRGTGAQLQPMEAYYMTLPLPGETDASFKLVRPFTPVNRPNMTAWMAAQAAPDGTPQLYVYRFPRQANVFGPQQVEARINQDPDISARISLLDQAGSRVLRGNLLVVPIGESVIYVQPLYLQATGTGGAPTELQFVIVATQDDVEMRPTLAEALAAAVVGDTAAATAGANVEGTGIPGDPSSFASPQDLADQALAAYQRGEDALQRGDWQAYGEAQAELARALEQLAGAGAPPAAEESPAAATPAP